jgi:hypothetical protein
MIDAYTEVARSRPTSLSISGIGSDDFVSCIPHEVPHEPLKIPSIL